MVRRRGFIQDNIFVLTEIMRSRSAAVGCLGIPKVDFSETHRIAYLAPEMPNFAPKKFFRHYSRPVDDPRVPRTNFSEYHQIAYLDPKILILNRKKIWLIESVGRRLQRASGHRGPIFQNAAKSHIWILKY